jgi:hypothetical protein
MITNTRSLCNDVFIIATLCSVGYLDDNECLQFISWRIITSGHYVASDVWMVTSQHYIASNVWIHRNIT